MLRHAFVNALVSPTNKNDSLRLGVTPRRLLAEQFSRGRHQHNSRLWTSRARVRRFASGGSEKRLHGFKQGLRLQQDRKSTRLNSSHVSISYAVFCLKKKMKLHE